MKTDMIYVKLLLLIIISANSHELLSQKECEFQDILILNDPKVRDQFFYQLNSYKDSVDQEFENGFFVDISPTLFNDFFNSIIKEALSKDIVYSKDYHFNIYPKNYSDSKECMDDITIIIDKSNCNFQLSIGNQFNIDNECSEHDVIYTFQIINNEIVNFQRVLAG